MQNYKIQRFRSRSRAQSRSRALKCQYWPNRNCGVCRCEIGGISRKIYRITFLYFREKRTGIPCISCSAEGGGTHRLGTINALVYQSFNFEPKVCFPSTVRNFSPFFYFFFFVPLPPEATVKRKVAQYTKLGQLSRCRDTLAVSLAENMTSWIFTKRLRRRYEDFLSKQSYLAGLRYLFFFVFCDNTHRASALQTNCILSFRIKTLHQFSFSTINIVFCYLPKKIRSIKMSELLLFNKTTPTSCTLARISHLSIVEAFTSCFTY